MNEVEEHLYIEQNITDTHRLYGSGSHALSVKYITFLVLNQFKYRHCSVTSGFSDFQCLAGLKEENHAYDVRGEAKTWLVLI